VHLNKGEIMFKAIIFTIALMVTVGSVAMGCTHNEVPPVNTGDGSPEAASALDSLKWELVRIDGEDLKLVEGDKPFLSFDKEKGSAGGNTGCNVFGGSYEQTGENAIRIFDTISTMRACIEDDRMTVERKFMAALLEVDRFEIEDKSLKLFKGDALRLEFRGVKKEN